VLLLRSLSIIAILLFSARISQLSVLTNFNIFFEITDVLLCTRNQHGSNC
jgi:hypothetical protein